MFCMDLLQSLEVKSYEAVKSDTAFAGSFGTVHRADWHGSVSTLFINIIILPS